jgi:hypothetical protein
VHFRHGHGTSKTTDDNDFAAAVIEKVAREYAGSEDDIRRRDPRWTVKDVNAVRVWRASIVG